MKIGLVDIDTSHPRNWIPFLREMGHDVVGLWDGGSVHSPAYVQQCAKEWQVPRVCDELRDLVPLVDCAIIHSCNWDLHVSRAAPFLDADKAVLIDKPLAGRVRDLRQLLTWAEQGKRLSGGSSLRTAVEVRSFLAQPAQERGEVRQVLAGCGTDPFNYGIHAYSLLWAVMGGGAISVRFLGEQPQWLVEVHWPGDRRGLVSMGGNGLWLPSYATVVTSNHVFHLAPQTTPDPLYRELLRCVLPYLSGECLEAPIPMRQLIEPELAAVAALESRRRGGASVALDELDEDAEGYAGAVFAAGYRAQYGK